MQTTTTTSKLDCPVDIARDHILGPADADITLVEYGSYDCPHCRTANARILEVRRRFGNRLRYVFRHRPIQGSELARRAAELVERIDDPRLARLFVSLTYRISRHLLGDALADRLGYPPQRHRLFGAALATLVRLADWMPFLVPSAVSRFVGVRFWLEASDYDLASLTGDRGGG